MRPVYVIIGVCTMDDVLMGTRFTYRSAKERADKIHKKPSLTLVKHQSSDSQYLATRVYQVQNDNVKCVYEVWK